ncbi:MAG: type IV pilus assembly protein PilM [Candidatus Saccharimonadales bacterium]
MHVPFLYRDKPVFGLDVGQSAAKVVQLAAAKTPKVEGYGFVEFNENYIDNGEITDIKAVAKLLKPLLNKMVIGSLKSNRVAASVPIAHTFTRVLSLPEVSEEDLAEAVKLEAEQYIPLPIADLYLDHQILPSTHTDKKTQAKTVDVLMVAVPKNIIESYEKLFTALGLEGYIVEPSLFAIVRAVKYSVSNPETPRVIIDFGAKSSDLAIYDEAIRFTSTVATGGEHLTEKIAASLNLKPQQAQSLKTHHGLNKSRWQKDISEAVQPLLNDLGTEIKKLVNYWKDKSGKEIEELVLVGGGANLPGLPTKMNEVTGMNIVIANPWKNLKLAPLQPPHPLEVTLYSNAIGLALKEVAND